MFKFFAKKIINRRICCLLKLKMGVIVAFFCIIQKSNAQYGEAQATLEKTAMFIGDQVVLTIVISNCNEAELKAVLWDSLAAHQFEKLEETPLKVISNSAQSFSATLTSFEIGSLEVPAIPLVFLRDDGQIDTFFTNPLPLKVYPVQTDSLNLAPIKDIMLEEKDISDYILPISLVLLGFISIGIYYFWHQKNLRKAAVLYESQQKPKAKALRRLRNLEAQQWPQQGKIKDFCSELTFIVKAFLEEEFHFDATRMTSNELLAHCKNHEILNAQYADLQAIINISDYVKFAQGEAEIAFCEQAVLKVERLLEV